MNSRLTIYAVVVTGFIMDGLMTYIFTMTGEFPQLYEMNNINTSLYGLIYTHMTVIALISSIAYLLSLADNRHVYIAIMAVVGVSTWYPVVHNVIIIFEAL